MRGRDIAIILGVIVLIVILLGVVAGAGGMGYGMMGPNGTFQGPGVYPFRFGFGWWFVLMGIVMLVFWGIVIGGLVWLVAWLIRQAQGTGPEAGGGRRALDILQERYARGELTREQYEQMRRDLEGR
ncbi:MAG: SHOCT domain-containing protein [Bacteroidetes bacterium]|nr:SHOCT domain-containing protein [Bacteroidota bacterium]